MNILNKASFAFSFSLGHRMAVSIRELNVSSKVSTQFVIKEEHALRKIPICIGRRASLYCT